MEEACVYAFPILIGFSALNDYNVDKISGAHFAPVNQLHDEARVFTPKDTTIVTPNSDTPYSMVPLDLRAEPMVICLPEIEKARYCDVQLTDMYTNNYGYTGSRTTGNGEIFYSLAAAKIIIESWRRHYNTKRPHSSPGYRPPAPRSSRGRLRHPEPLRRQPQP